MWTRTKPSYAKLHISERTSSSAKAPGPHGPLLEPRCTESIQLIAVTRRYGYATSLPYNGTYHIPYVPAHPQQSVHHSMRAAKREIDWQTNRIDGTNRTNRITYLHLRPPFSWSATSAFPQPSPGAPGASRWKRRFTFTSKGHERPSLGISCHRGRLSAAINHPAVGHTGTLCYACVPGICSFSIAQDPHIRG